MKINLEIETIIGGYKITASRPGDTVSFSEAYAAKITQVPARIKEMLVSFFEEKKS